MSPSNHPPPSAHYKNLFNLKSTTKPYFLSSMRDLKSSFCIPDSFFPPVSLQPPINNYKQIFTICHPNAHKNIIFWQTADMWKANKKSNFNFRLSTAAIPPCIQHLLVPTHMSATRSSQSKWVPWLQRRRRRRRQGWIWRGGEVEENGKKSWVGWGKNRYGK